MRTKIARKRTMMSAAELAFPRVGALVERAQRRSGSRMAAYHDVARAIGVTGGWVRKFLGRQAIRLDADTFLQIEAAYRAECERWETEAANERARFLALGKDDDAMGGREVRCCGVAAGADTAAARPSAGVVPALVDEGGR